jgi:hypothetical protein
MPALHDTGAAWDMTIVDPLAHPRAGMFVSQ